MRASENFSTLYRYFAGLTEHTFHSQLGVADPALVSYVTNLLLRFLRSDSVYRVRDLAGRRIEEVALMLLEAEARAGDARREVHRHVGDFTLFWLGVYPESLQRRDETAGLSSMYTEMGKRAYYIASTIATEREEDAPSEVLERLSRRFELCAFGLREVRREWENRDDAPPAGLLLN